MKQLWILVLAVSLSAIAAPVMAAAVGSDDANGSEETLSGYERAVELIEASDYEDAIRVLQEVNGKEPGNQG